MKFNRDGRKEYNVGCHEPRTVLEAIKSSSVYKKMTQMKDENIVIQLGKEDRDSIVATHFPCSCIEDGQTLIISHKREKVEESEGQHSKTVRPRNKYSVFYIDREGGVNTKTKELFRSSAVKQFKYLCVYGEKGMTVEEALTCDGRFLDDLGEFTLSDNDNPDVVTFCTERVDNLHRKLFKICLPLNKADVFEKEQEHCASNRSHQKYDVKALLDVAQQRGTSVKTAVKTAAETAAKTGGDDNTEDIYDRLRQQYPGLKELMESRFPGNSYQEELKLRRENFGKIQQSFSEIHRIKKLEKLAESVCKLIVKDVCTGTGFVLFDNFILTNAHLFGGYVEEGKLQEHIEVFALFNYEEPEPNTNFYTFTVKKTLIDFDMDLDYAILELNPQGQKLNNKTKSKKAVVPAGLLKKFGPVPPNGEACIIGHPAGGVKKMDPTCIIEKEKRGQAINDHLRMYDNVFTIYSIINAIKDQGIESIMVGGKKDNVATYNTFMYHGASGSPVFDAHGQVFGLHTAGFVYAKLNQKESVIEYAQPLLAIFDNFVRRLKGNGKEELRKRVKEEAKQNPYLNKALGDESSDSDEPMDVDKE